MGEKEGGSEGASSSLSCHVILHGVGFRVRHVHGWEVEKVVGLTGFVIIHVFIASFPPAQGERNQMVNAKFTRPVNVMPMSTGKDGDHDRERERRE